jgi:hypothetical protein
LEVMSADWTLRHPEALGVLLELIIYKVEEVLAGHARPVEELEIAPAVLATYGDALSR